MSRESVERRADELDPGRRARIRARMKQSEIEYELRSSLTRLGRISADDAAALPMDDVVELTRYLARSRYLAQADRKLMFEVRSPEHLPFTRASRIRAIALLTLTAIVVAAFCGLFGRIFL